MHKRNGVACVTAGLAFAFLCCAAPGGVTSAAAQESDRPELAKLVPGDRLQMRAEDINIDALTLESDFTVFMNQKRCSEELRLKALRKLWTLLPVVVTAENSPI
jgi:hypothetical protein